MNKKNIASLIIIMLLVVLFNIVFFSSTFSPLNKSIWVCYVFVHIAFVLTAIATSLPVNELKPYLLGKTNVAIAGAYLTFELIAAFTFLYKFFELFQVALVVQSVILVAYLIASILNGLSNSTIRERAQKEYQESAYTADALYFINDMLERTDDMEVKKQLRSIRDLAMASQIHSSEQVHDMESNVIHLLMETKEQVESGENEQVKESLREIMNEMKSRNNMLKMIS